tara:strand:- start:5955 stop:6170 length:216 start_codon:yes stop_codon:yes gene_type:complete
MNKDKKWIETLQERNRVLNELLQLTQIENEELKKQLTLTDVVSSKCVHKAKLLTKEEVAENRSNAYKYLEF